MKFSATFRNFLRDVVDLNQGRLDQLQSRVSAIVDLLSKDGVIGLAYQTYIPQGSWAQKTIIKPVGEYDEFDADFLLHLKNDLEWLDKPKQYIKAVRAALKNSAVYGEKVRKKNRCVRVVYANDCHIDIVPHVVLADGRQVIVNYSENAFEETNPEGFTNWMKERDKASSGNLRRVIRLIKYLRDSKKTFSCPSIILTTVIGSTVRSDGDYSDVPSALTTMLGDLISWLDSQPDMPYLADPSCPGTSFNHRWSQERYENFRAKMKIYAAKAEAALKEEDPDKSLALWQELFGPKFKPPTDKSVETARSFSFSDSTVGMRASSEEFIEERGYRYVGGYEAVVQCTVERKEGFRNGCLRTIGHVNKNRWLKFRVATNVPWPFQVYWKVRNHGQEAASAGQLRGEISLDTGSLARRERTAYIGTHYVEAYVVKDGLVLARSRHEVNVR